MIMLMYKIRRNDSRETLNVRLWGVWRKRENESKTEKKKKRNILLSPMQKSIENKEMAEKKCYRVELNSFPQ